MIIVYKTCNPEPKHSEQSHKYVFICHIGPQKRRKQNRRDDHQPAHSRRALFVAVMFMQFFALFFIPHILAYMQFFKFANDHRAEQKAQNKSGDGGHARAERQIPENIENAYFGM
jgi:hypothetical protein